MTLESIKKQTKNENPTIFPHLSLKGLEKKYRQRYNNVTEVAVVAIVFDIVIDKIL